jgi:hypothetical protein
MVKMAAKSSLVILFTLVIHTVPRRLYIVFVKSVPYRHELHWVGGHHELRI